jgi:hypothetical protein
VFGEDRGSKLHTVHLVQITKETTSYCWFLWAVLERSTNRASSCAREKINCRNICFDYANNLLQYFALLLLLLLLTADSSHSVAVVLTPVQTKELRINIPKWNNTKTQYKNTKHSKYKDTHYQNTPHTLTHILQNKLKQPKYKIHTKWNSHNTIKYLQYKVTLLYMVLLSPRPSP